MARWRIGLKDISVGHELPWDVYDGEGRLLLSKGHLIITINQVEDLIQRGIFADMESSGYSAANAPIEKEKPSAAFLVMEARRRLELISPPQKLKENFIEQIFRIRELIREACITKKEVALAAIMLEKTGRYSIRHSIDTAITCHVVGTDIGVDDKELTSIVAAALTMNISMVTFQDALQTYSKELTQEQRESIKRHPIASGDYIKQAGVTDKIWLDAVFDHHEAFDGSGYPNHKKGTDISFAARLVSLSDVFCARVSGRDYRSPLPSNAALRGMFLTQTSVEGKTLMTKFIRALGVFPAGTPVKLENGEIAIVIRQGEKANAPYVAAVVGPRGAPLATPIFRDTTKPLYVIREVANWEDLGPTPSLQSLWGKDGTAS